MWPIALRARSAAAVLQSRSAGLAPRHSLLRVGTPPRLCAEADCDAIVDELQSLVVSAHARAPLDASSLYRRLEQASASAARLLLRDATSTELRLNDLRGLLAARGLPIKGNKEELRARLLGVLTEPHAVPPTASVPPAAEGPPADNALCDAIEEVLREVARAHAGLGPQTGIFCDGACSPNPGPGGWGVVEVHDGSVRWRARGDAADTTNNRMELVALIEALRRVPPGQSGVVYSDSNLCVRTVNEWAAKWERDGWRRQGGKQPVENLDLVKEAFSLARERPRVSVVWIRGHDGSTWNEYADRLASWRP